MKTNLNIKGMHCKSCVKVLEMELADKVKNLKLDESGKAMIDFDEKKISLQEIKDIIKNAGYQA